MAKKRETKRPIKNLLVRQAGQSLRTQMISILFDRLMLPEMTVIACLMGVGNRTC